ncbi:hypothetical protein [Lysinibacillus xylanilyticus]|uniref:hypothetical protein n=1 Tax=Lysinibacillus xylanilyticus TaxID=582475 RepID=UPI0036DAFB47
MKIVRLEGTRTGFKVRADLARLAARSSQQFLTYAIVVDFLKGKSKLDYELSKIIHTSDKSVLYIEKFIRNKVTIKKSDHIIALLCIFSEDSFGAKILADEFYDYVEELQDRLNECAEHNYNGVHSAVSIMDFLGHSDFLDGKPYDVWYLLYNLFLHKEGLCLILEDTDTPDSSLLFNMKYKIETYAEKLRS